MDFRKAITAHLQWKSRLAMFLQGDSSEWLDPNTVGKVDQCELGKWLHGEAKSKFDNSLEYRGLLETHATFHRCAAEIVKWTLSGDKAEATRLLEGDFNAYSSATVLAITRLERMLGKP
ncbi:MAG TPA: CZB domain-containing protein [Geothrix sp.]|nr:CZB domain-containing protein [Geothrix sp.]